jgi:hypothetical protein
MLSLSPGQLSLDLADEIHRVAEISIGLICACLPAIGGLVTYKLRQSSSTCDNPQARTLNMRAVERTSSTIYMTTDEATNIDEGL